MAGKRKSATDFVPDFFFFFLFYLIRDEGYQGVNGRGDSSKGLGDALSLTMINARLCSGVEGSVSRRTLTEKKAFKKINDN